MPFIPGTNPQQRFSAGAGAISSMQHALGMGKGPAAGTTPIFGGVLQNLMASAATTANPLIPIFQEGLGGGMAGFQLGEQNVWAPTSWGSFLTRPTAEGAGTLRATGGFLPAGAVSISQRLSFGSAMAGQLMQREHLVRSGARGARQAIQESLNYLSPIQWAAYGNARDYLRATSTLSEHVASGLAGVHPTMSRGIGAGPRVPLNVGGHLSNLARTIMSGPVPMSTALSKPEALLQGVFGADPHQVSPFGQMFRGGRMNYQHVAFPSISAQTVGMMEGAAVPRISVQGGMLREFGEFQEVFGQVGVVGPRSRFGRAITRGAAGYEGIILNERFRNMAFQGGRVEVGTAMSVLGQKFNVAGFAATDVLGGRDALITASLMRDPEAYARASLSHVIANAWKANKGRLPQEFQNAMRATFGDFELRQTQIMLAPKAGNITSTGMATRTVRALAQATGVSAPWGVDRLANVGRVRTATIPMSFRGNFAASNLGVRMSGTNMMMMASMGRHSGHIARSLLRHVRGTRGVEARQTLAFLNPMLGRAANLSGVTQMGALAFDSRIHGLATAQTKGQLAALREGGILPMGPRAIKLSRSINVPTERAFALLGSDLTNWAQFRGSGFATDVLPMPTLSGFAKMAAGDESARAFLPGFLGQYAKVVGAAQGLERAVAGGGDIAAAQIGLETAYGKMGSMVMSHSQKGGLLQNILNPRMQIGKSVYATLQSGQAAAALRGVSGPMDTAVGSVAMSPAMARKMGLGKGTINQIVGGREFYVGGQVYPAVRGATSRVMRLRIDPSMTGEVISTNVADRLAGFRDLDWDKMHLYLFPSEIARKSRASLRLAHLEQITHVRDLYKMASGSVLLPGAASVRGLSAQMGVEKAISQKVLTPLWDKPVRMWQGSALNLYGNKAGRVTDALGVAYQMAIQKGGGGAGTGLLTLLGSLGEGSLEGAIPEIQTALGKVSVAARNAGQVGFGNVTRGLAEQVGRTAVHATTMSNYRSFSDLYSTQTGKGAGEFLGMLMSVRGQNPGTGRLADHHILKMMGLGKLVSNIDVLADQAGLTIGGVNASLKGEAAEAGNIWSRIPKGGRIALGAFGALLGLRMLKSHLIGDEPDMGPGMRIPPEVAARMAMGPVDHGAPLPPDPMVGPGLHQSMMPRPIVPFSPPPARINSPLTRGQEIRIDATETSGMDLHMMGLNMSAGLELAGAPSSLTGVYSSNLTSPSRLADLNAREDRMNSRFFNPV